MSFEKLISCADPEGGWTWCPDPLENDKNIGFLSNTCPDPLKITKLPIQIQCWAIIGPPAKRISLAGR